MSKTTRPTRRARRHVLTAIAVGATIAIAPTAPAAAEDIWQDVGVEAVPLGQDPSGERPTYPRFLTPYNDSLVFSAGVKDGGEPWIFDGTTARRLAQIAPDRYYGSRPDGFTRLGDWMYFDATTDDGRRELWRTNGTTTEQVTDISAGYAQPSELTVLGGWLYFTAEVPTGTRQLWRTNGTTTEQVTTSRDDVGGLAVLGDRLHFYASDAAHGIEPWRTDGTTTEMVADVNPAGSSQNRWLLGVRGGVVAGGWLYLVLDDGTGSELHRTDGVTTELISGDVSTTASPSSPSQLTPVGSWVYFTAEDHRTADGNEQLWRTDGTRTERLTNLRGESINQLTAHAGTLHYLTTPDDDGTSPGRIWRTQGGTPQVVATLGGPGSKRWSYDSLQPVYLMSVADQLWVIADDHVTGVELYHLGTCGLSQVAEIEPGQRHSFPSSLVAHRGTVYFLAGFNSPSLYRITRSGSVARPTQDFSDVAVCHPFFTEISWAAKQGVTTGYGDGTFRPNTSVNRGAMAAFLYRFSGSPAFTAPTTPTFPDVPATHPFFTEIEWLVAQEVTTGYGDGTFRPNSTVNRGSMAAFLHRLAGSPDVDLPATSSFTDVSTTHPFREPIEWLVAEGVTTGYGDGTFRPNTTVNRGAMAAFLHRYAQR